MVYLYLTISILLNSTANILLKFGANQGISFSGTNIFSLLRSNMFTFLGLTMFGLSAVSYFLTLRSVPLNIAYPVIIIFNLLLTNIAAHIYFNEKVNSLQILGYGFLLVGITFIFYFGHRSS